MKPWSTSADVVREARKLWERGKLLAAIYPLPVRFNGPRTSELGERFAEVRDWIRELDASSKDARGYGYDVIWEERDLRLLGRNRVPVGIALPTREDAARLARVTPEVRHYDELLEQTRVLFPELVPWVNARPLKVLAHRSVWPQLLSVVRWLSDNPASGSYVREIDLPGVDTKLIEDHRPLLDALLRFLRPGVTLNVFEERWGLRRKPLVVRFRILDASRRLGGFSDLTVPLEELAVWEPEETDVFITENELNGLAFPARRNSLVIFGLGYGVSLLERLPWLQGKSVWYWGDIDTHGFAMLDRARAAVPHVASFLMDRDTLLAHRSSWAREPKQASGPLKRLLAAETDVYDELILGTHGDGVRLEQERVRFTWLAARLAMLSSLDQGGEAV